MSEHDCSLEDYPESSDTSNKGRPRLITGVAWSDLESVPDDWDAKNLASSISIITGNNFSSDDFSDKDGVPLIRIRDLGTGDTTVNYTGEYNDKYLIEDFDLLVGMDGEFEPHFWFGGKALLNQRVCRIEPNQNLNKVFLRFALEKPLWYIQKSLAGTTVKHLSQSNIKKINLPTPLLEEQRKIASILYTLDQAIRLEDAIIEQFNRLKEGVKNDLFGLTDYYRDSDEAQLGPREIHIPKDWRNPRLKEVCTIVSGSTLPQEYQNGIDGDYPVYKVRAVFERSKTGC